VAVAAVSENNTGEIVPQNTKLGESRKKFKNPRQFFNNSSFFSFSSI
jgi:hypothetical protein